MPTTTEVNTAATNFIDDTNTADQKINGAPGNVTDRHGVVTKNLEQLFSEIGYLVPVAFSSGLTPSAGNFTVEYLDNIYSANPSEVPFTTTSSFDSNQWLLVPGVSKNDITSTEFYRRDDGTPDLVNFVRWRGRAFFGDSYSFSGYTSSAEDDSGTNRNWGTGSFLNASSETGPVDLPDETTSGAATQLDEGTNLFTASETFLVLPASLAATTETSTITLTDASTLDSSGLIRIGAELIYYSGKSGNDLTGVVRGFNPIGQTNGRQVISSPVADSSLVKHHVGGSSYATTALTVSITASDTVFNVGDTSTFATSGDLRVGKEIVSYSGKTSTSFTGVTRGQYGTTAVAQPDTAALVQGDKVYQVHVGSRLRGYEANAQVVVSSDRGLFSLVGASQSVGSNPAIGVAGIARLTSATATNAWGFYAEAIRSDVAAGGLWACELGVGNFGNTPATQKVNPYNDGYFGHSKGVMINSGIDETNASDIDVFYHARGEFSKDITDPGYDGTIFGARALAMIVSPDGGLRETSSDGGISADTKKTLMLGERHAITGSESTADDVDPAIAQELFMDDSSKAWTMNRVNAPDSSPALFDLQSDGVSEALFAKRSGGGVSINTADNVVSLSSRTDIVSYWATYSVKHKNNDIILTPLGNFLVDSAYTDLPSLSGLRPLSSGEKPMHFGAEGANDTTEIDAFISYYSTERVRTVYVSASGTGDGNTFETPTTLDNAMRYVRALMLVASNTEFRISLAAGTHTPQIRQNFWDGSNDKQDWFFGTNWLSVIGPDVSGKTPTAIIDDDGLNNNWLRQDHHFARACRVYMKDVKFTNFNTGKPVKLRYGGGAVWMENVHCDGTQGLLETRGMAVRVTGSGEYIIDDENFGWGGYTSQSDAAISTENDGDLLVENIAQDTFSWAGKMFETVPGVLYRVEIERSSYTVSEITFGIGSTTSGSSDVLSLNGSGVQSGYFRGDGSTVYVQLKASGLGGTAKFKSVRVQALYTRIQNHTETALILQDGYLRVGDHVGVPGTGAIEFDGIGGAVAATRDVTGYIRGNTVTNGSFLWYGENRARIRTQGNILVAWSDAVVIIDSSCEWDNDNSNYPDIFSGEGSSTRVLRAFAKTSTPINQEGTGSGIMVPHRSFNGPDDTVGPSSVSGPGATTSVTSGEPYEICTADTADWSAFGGPVSAVVGDKFTATSSGDISALGSAYRLKLDISEVSDGGTEDLGVLRTPKWLLFSPDCVIKIQYVFEFVTTGDTVLNTRLGSVLMATAKFKSSSGGIHRWEMNTTIYGAGVGKSTGYYSSNQILAGSNTIESSAGDTGSFNNSHVRSLSGDVNDWRFELVFANASDYARVVSGASWIAP